jgi:hypothetical protein
MPLGRHVRDLEGSWEDSVRIDKLSEKWRSRQDVARIDGSDSDDSSEGSLPALLDGSDADRPEDQSLEDLDLGLDTAGLISSPEDTVVYGRIPFGLALSCRAVPPRPCLGSIVVHDIRCTAVTPFIKDCLTEAILIPLVHHAADVPLDTKRMIV